MKAKTKNGNTFVPIELVITFTSQHEVNEFYLGFRHSSIACLLGIEGTEIIDALKPHVSDSSFDTFCKFSENIKGTVL